MGSCVGGAWLPLGWIWINRDTSSGASGTGAENVWQNASVAVLLEDSGGRTHQNILPHGCFMCLVGFGLLDSVDKNSAAHFNPGKQVASLHAGRSEIPRCVVGGLVSYNETLCACVDMQTESSVSVAQSVGGCVWLGWTRCS